MALSNYKKKRKFDQTPEPAAIVNINNSKDELVFVVQKHAASRLHYDFRLEMNGVLKSWAIPKGPSLNPDDKRLAIMVEDHPYNYKDFEGNIPEGNYGAGNVIIWDKGTYTQARNSFNKKESEAILLNDLSKGHISFILNGKKLKGEFALVNLKKAKKDNSWLLIKKNDTYASKEDVLKNDRSVISNNTIEKLKKKYGKSKTY